MPMYSERQLDRAMSRAGVQETPGQFRRTFANLRNTNPEMYLQKRAEQRDALAAYRAQQAAPQPGVQPAQAASNLASKLAYQKMQQGGGMRPAVQPGRVSFQPGAGVGIGMGGPRRLPPVRAAGYGSPVSGVPSFGM